MAVVKGSRVRHWRVVEHRPRVRIWLATGLLVLFVAAVQIAFWYGYKNGMEGQERASKDLSAIRLELDAARASEADLRQEYENVMTGAEVDQKALEEVRIQVMDLRSQVAELEEENQFYRNLMAPSGNRSGLAFGTVELSESDKERHYRFKIVMQQLATDHAVLNGTLSVNIIGQRDGELLVFALSDLSKDVPSPNIKLRFKYFQNIEGELFLPENFEPERIELEARSTGRKATTIEKRFGWLVETRE